jgi:tellurite resistance protein TerC
MAGPGLWIGFGMLVAAGLVADQLCNKRFLAGGHAIRGAIYASCGWVGLALSFAIFLGVYYGAEAGMVFVTGYLVEESLSVDNLVVIALIFKSFHIKPHDQGPVLKWGILGAVVFRLVFVFMGVWLLEHMHSMIYIFGGVLLWSAWKMYFEEDDDDDGAHDHSKGDSWMMRMMTTVIPYNAEGKSHTFLEYIDGKAHATPMLAALVVVELSDLLFAVDSIPCILGLTHDLFLVFSSNMFAILGLRSLYLLLAEALDKVKNLKIGLAVVLGFVGTKMMLGEWFPLPQSVSLLVIFGTLGATVASSMVSTNMGRDKPKLVLPM